MVLSLLSDFLFLFKAVCSLSQGCAVVKRLFTGLCRAGSLLIYAKAPCQSLLRRGAICLRQPFNDGLPNDAFSHCYGSSYASCSIFCSCFSFCDTCHGMSSKRLFCCCSHLSGDLHRPVGGDDLHVRAAERPDLQPHQNRRRRHDRRPFPFFQKTHLHSLLNSSLFPCVTYSTRFNT